MSWGSFYGGNIVQNYSIYIFDVTLDNHNVDKGLDLYIVLKVIHRYGLNVY